MSQGPSGQGWTVPPAPVQVHSLVATGTLGLTGSSAAALGCLFFPCLPHPDYVPSIIRVLSNHCPLPSPWSRLMASPGLLNNLSLALVSRPLPLS